VLGPVPVPVTQSGRPRRAGAPPPGEHWERALVRVPPGSGSALAAALKAAQAARMARGSGEAVRVRIDPPDIG
jgi:primosomal protein N' (replication factor Y)